MARWNRKWPLHLGFTLLIWFSLAIFFAIDEYRDSITRGDTPNFALELYWKFSFWLPWGILSPLIYYITQKKPIERSNLPGSIGINLLACLVITLIKNLFYFILTYPIRFYPEWTSFFEKWKKELSYNFQNDVLVYLCIIGFYYIIKKYFQAKELEIEKYQIEAQLDRAQLQILKMQLQPHFLFNALNSISALVYKDAELANKTLTRLSNLLRGILDNSGTQEVALRDELSILENYLEIEKVRFQERLRIIMNIQPETLEALVPNLILQPIVENAIRHGVAPFAKMGTIEIRSQRVDGMLRLQVCDNGPGIKEDQQTTLKKGIGLSTTYERLEKLYKSNFQFEICNSPDGGLMVNIELPYRVPDEREHQTAYP
ncbi:MAG: histidine kinase [candidate division KSB1 bacterium]|nr:histidine kinase [candidate division KSB1 bacterium]